MAEALARLQSEERRIAVEARSCGVRALAGEPAAANAVRAISELDGDLSAHRAQDATQELVDWADRILVMELAHASSLREQFPSSDGKVQLLGTYGGTMEIADPYGRWIFAFRRSRDEISHCVETLLDRLPPNPL